MKANHTYLSDGTKASVLNASGAGYDYNGSFTYSHSANGSRTLESVAFSGGRIRKSGSSYTVDYYVTDHLGSVRAIVNASGSVVEQNDYYPFGARHANGLSTLSGNRWRFSGKEGYDSAFGIAYDDFGARLYDRTAWTAIDPLAEKYYGISPYSYCAGNPVRFVDLDGRDWYRDSNGNILWTNLTSQESLDEHNINGYYLGSIVVCFDGSFDERLGWDIKRQANGNIDGEGAITAAVTVYGANGSEDIAIYTGFTMTSDYTKFGAIADGEYNVTYRKDPGKGSIPKHYMLNKGGAIDCINNMNPSPKEYDPCSNTQKNGIFIHRTNNDGWAGDTPSIFKCVSSGCLLIRAGDWDNFSKQVGNNGFKLLLNRK